MSLPSPQLDNRTWADLAEEARALIPRYAPEWTDHNIHDPGITLFELLAYQTELELYRLNSITAAHQQAFLDLLGRKYRPTGPQPAATLLAYEPLPDLPSTVREIAVNDYLVPRQPAVTPPRPHRTLLTDPTTDPTDPATGQLAVPEFGFRAAHAVSLTRLRLAAVQAFDSHHFRDITDLLSRSKPAAVWGDDPEVRQGVPDDLQPALYLGLDIKLWTRLPQDLTLWMLPAGYDADGLVPPALERSNPLLRCSPPPPPKEPVPETLSGFQPYNPGRPTPPHGYRVEWEYQAGCGWRSMTNARAFRDETTGFTRPGRVVVPAEVLGLLAENKDRFLHAVGTVPAPHFYVRCRLAAGRPDAAPLVRGIFADALLVQQWDLAETALSLARHAPGEPLLLRHLQLTDETAANVADAAKDLRRRGWGDVAAGWSNWPVALCPEKLPKARTDAAGRQWLPLVVLGIGTGQANQVVSLPCDTSRTKFALESPDQPDLSPPIRVVTDQLVVWTVEPPWGWNPQAPSVQDAPWTQVGWSLAADLVLCSRQTPGFRYVADTNQIVFGDGEQGRVPPPGAVIVAGYRWTVADAANFGPGALWGRAAETEPGTGTRPALVPRTRFRNPIPAVGGRDAESRPAALSRLAAEFGSTELLLQKAREAGGTTLDGVDLTQLPAPPLAVTLVDFESLARRVPGTRVARARAWAGLSPEAPGLTVPGAVTVVVIPELPRAQPVPTPSLLEQVRTYLEARRPIACRVAVVGPTYVRVRVQAVVHVAPGLKAAVQKLARETVRRFLHSLHGGAAGTGWPFGRAVHTGELLHILAAIPNVKHVTDLRLATNDGPWSTDAVSLPAHALPALEDLVLHVREDT